MRKGLKEAAKRARWAALYLLLRAILLILNVARERAARWFAKYLAAALFYLLRRERRKTIKHLKQAFPHWDEKEIKRAAKRVFVNLALNAVEFVMAVNGREDIFKRVEVHNLKIMKDLVEKGGGFIGVSAHLGNWELMAAYFARMGYPLMAVVAEAKDRRINGLVKKFREKAGLQLVHKDTAFLPIAGEIRRGKFLAFLVDQDSNYDGVFVDFFGRPAFTPKGPAILARRVRRPVVPVFIVREKDGNNHIYVEDPIFPRMDRYWKDDVYEMTKRYTQKVEEYIRKYPDQWVWMHKRWKTSPRDL